MVNQRYLPHCPVLVGEPPSSVSVLEPLFSVEEPPVQSAFPSASVASVASFQVQVPVSSSEIRKTPCTCVLSV